MKNDLFQSSEEIQRDILFKKLKKVSKDKTIKPMEKVKEVSKILRDISTALKNHPKA